MEELQKLFRCVFTTGNDVVCKCANHKLTLNYNGSFRYFLDAKKHYLFHQLDGAPGTSCLCNPSGCPLKRECKIEKWKFTTIYDNSGTIIDGHVIKCQRRIVQDCLHQYASKPIQVEDLDISVLSFLLKYCLGLSTLEKAALGELISLRNEICHLSKNDYISINMPNVNSMWNRLEMALLTLVNQSYQNTYREIIKMSKRINLERAEIDQVKEMIAICLKGIEDSEAHTTTFIRHIEDNAASIKDHMTNQLHAAVEKGSINTQQSETSIRRDITELGSDLNRKVEKIHDLLMVMLGFIENKEVVLYVKNLVQRTDNELSNDSTFKDVEGRTHRPNGRRRPTVESDDISSYVRDTGPIQREHGIQLHEHHEHGLETGHEHELETEHEHGLEKEHENGLETGHDHVLEDGPRQDEENEHGIDEELELGTNTEVKQEIDEWQTIRLDEGQEQTPHSYSYNCLLIICLFWSLCLVGGIWRDFSIIVWVFCYLFCTNVIQKVHKQQRGEKRNTDGRSEQEVDEGHGHGREHEIETGNERRSQNANERDKRGMNMKMTANSLTDNVETLIIKHLPTDNKKEIDTDRIQILSKRKNCIFLELLACPGVFKNTESFRSAILELVREVLISGNIDMSIQETIKVELCFDEPLTKREYDIVLDLMSHPYSEQVLPDTKVVMQSQTETCKYCMEKSEEITYLNQQNRHKKQMIKQQQDIIAQHEQNIQQQSKQIEQMTLQIVHESEEILSQKLYNQKSVHGGNLPEDESLHSLQIRSDLKQGNEVKEQDEEPTFHSNVQSDDPTKEQQYKILSGRVIIFCSSITTHRSENDLLRIEEQFLKFPKFTVVAEEFHSFHDILHKVYSEMRDKSVDCLILILVDVGNLALFDVLDIYHGLHDIPIVTIAETRYGCHVDLLDMEERLVVTAYGQRSSYPLLGHLLIALENMKDGDDFASMLYEISKCITQKRRNETSDIVERSVFSSSLRKKLVLK